MASRRKNNEVPVSLFSFQDIITSITGIMVLVVLLIILDIINSNMNNLPPSPFIGDISNLKQIVKDVKGEIEKEKGWLKENEDLLTKILSTNLAILPRLMEKEQNISDGLMKTITHVRDNKEKLNASISSVKGKNEKVKTEKNEIIILIDEKKKECQGKKTDIQGQKERIEDIKKEQEKIEKQVRFILDRNETRTALFTECSSKMIRVMLVKGENRIPMLVDGKKEMITTFVDQDGNAENLLKNFLIWFGSSQRNPSSDYIVILVKPSSSKYINMLSGFFMEKGFEFALEPLEEDKTGVFLNKNG